MGDNAGENIQEEGSDKEDNVDSNDSKDAEEEEESCQGPTLEDLDDQSRARPEDARKKGGGRCFRCNRCFGSLRLIVHQCRMFHSEQFLSKFKDSIVYPTPTDADLAKHAAVPGTPVGELRPTDLPLTLLHQGG